MRKTKLVLTIFFSVVVIASGIIFNPTPTALAALLNKDSTTTAQFNDNLRNVATAPNVGYVESDINNIIITLVRLALSLLGILFLTFIFVAGNQWMQAAGNEEKIKKSKARIQSAIVGLAIVLIAYALSYGFSSVLKSFIK